MVLVSLVDFRSPCFNIVTGPIIVAWPGLSASWLLISHVEVSAFRWLTVKPPVNRESSPRGRTSAAVVILHNLV